MDVTGLPGVIICKRFEPLSARKTGRALYKNCISWFSYNLGQRSNFGERSVLPVVISHTLLAKSAGLL